ncbi:MAG: TonB-dependent receptor, partial [Leptospiraceae bacterium]|nr:TonB-dependent receptor [Leptospiraceae bacterium]
VPKGAIFGQVVSGKFLYDKLELTLGIRYDEKYIKYKGIDSPYTEKYGLEYPFYPEEKRVFRRTSPRAGLVVFIMNGLNLKFMAGRAFREPSITELFGANTFTLASNPRELKPEIINTQEAALDWFITKNLNFKLNFFNTKFENQIAYSVANNNLSTNIYTLHHRGVESELIYEVKKLSYFMNFSYNQRVNEAVLDNTISQNKKALTWAPTNTQNFGVRGEYHDFSGSVSLQRQGPVYRRNSDFGTVDFYTNFVYVDPYAYPQYRSRVIPEWYNMNLRLSYNVTSNLNIGIFVSNALNRTQHLIKNFEFPFDYRRETRRVMLDVSAHF